MFYIQFHQVVKIISGKMRFKRMRYLRPGYQFILGFDDKNNHNFKKMIRLQ